MLTVPSPAPLTISQGGSDTVYDQWGAPSVTLSKNGAGFRLSITFYRYATIDGNLTRCPLPGSQFTCSDVFADATLGPLAASFFSSVVTKAFADGILA